MTDLMNSAKSDADNWHWRTARNIGAGMQLLIRPARPPKGLQSRKPDWWRLAIGAAIAGAALLLIALVFDGLAIQSARALPLWIRDSFGQVTEFGRAGWFLWPLAVVLTAMAALFDRSSRPIQLAIIAVSVRLQFVFLAIAVPSLFVTIVKRLIGRARPDISESIDPAHFSLFALRHEFASFPSGHATTAVAAAVAIGTVWPRARTALWIYAISIMASRVALNAHYPTDVLAAAIVGAVGALMVRHHFAMRRLGFSIASDRSIIRYRVPSSRRVRAVVRDLLAN